MQAQGAAWFAVHTGVQDRASTRDARGFGATLFASNGGIRIEQFGFGFTLNFNSFYLDPDRGGLFQFGPQAQYHTRTHGRLDPYVQLMGGVFAVSGPQPREDMAGVGLEPAVGLDYFLSDIWAIGVTASMPTVFTGDGPESYWAFRGGLKLYTGRSRHAHRHHVKRRHRRHVKKRRRRPRRRKKKKRPRPRL